MTEEVKQPILKEVDLHIKTNNTEHHTSEISEEQLIVRRGQPFTLTLKLTQPFNPDLHPLTIIAVTGELPSENVGTKSCFGIPDSVKRSPSAKAVWKVELHKNSSSLTGVLILNITPPAVSPIGEYELSVKHREEETSLATLVVLFNPWCPDDSVFLPDEKERQEYVMNEQGTIYRGSHNYISSMSWDFGQFEDNMVKICLAILDVNYKHMEDPAEDVSARCDPIYVGRVVSAMVNCMDDFGVLNGRWGGPYDDGFAPSHWSGSHAILNRWFTECYPVKYGQCWVFAGVMCSVMRLLGIPCRVVTNFTSAHDNNMNLTIDKYHADHGVEKKETGDSIWNFHVWVEGWMRRPDLAEDGKYDGWQVLDPTPQEMSDGLYCCGPAPVKAILNGDTHLKYDVPFVFAEVNADCVDWLVLADGSEVKMSSDTKRVGKNISTKAVGSDERLDITHTYKHKEGTEKEREVFEYATSRDFNNEYEMETEENPPPPEVFMQFEEVSKPMDGKDVSLRLVLHSESSVARPLSINISVQAMKYNGSPAANIQTELKEETLEPGKELSIPVLVPFSVYHKHMVESDSMNISAVVTDKEKPENTYLAVDDIVLQDPPISLTVPSEVKLYREASGEVVFMNPVDETLTNCTLTFSGSGLYKEEAEIKPPNLLPNKELRVKFSFVPYKTGKKTLIIDFDCSTFRDVKASHTVNVTP
ncbi:LOW QUALITY PROTEIN: protein-glutamine gamma-glutamyltransferase 2-like [Lates calcarifer]|uniref:Protein-glutamine gamma-glutamyltransferase 2 n=1 Tax=Lates calcarifer TaxID=8187 RepID=A0AAJ7LYL1_LATCA|nr:LOW QUALITY PROTEIN: protein-glutamine gamma-glutamyltransferase 2-like [Lates calcarifer]